VRLAPTNKVNVVPEVLSSVEYNLAPTPLTINGARKSHPRLFEKLSQLGDRSERLGFFHGYMDASFGQRGAGGNAGKLAVKSDYVRYLLGWLVHSSSPQGAVLKGWVQNRFGIPPTFHKGALRSRESKNYANYERDRARCLGGDEAVLAQFDLLYEFMQAEIALACPGTTHLILYRGVYGFDEHRIIKDMGGGRHRLWLNNLNSFTRSFERAWEFGDRVIEARVPVAKIFFDGGIIDIGVLTGEEEVMVIGGRYEVRLRWY
jgi:NAD+--dinitrogen-reductase ADP-D-ribosyltransferase